MSGERSRSKARENQPRASSRKLHLVLREPSRESTLPDGVAADVEAPPLHTQREQSRPSVLHWRRSAALSASLAAISVPHTVC